MNCVCVCVCLGSERSVTVWRRCKYIRLTWQKPPSHELTCLQWVLKKSPAWTCWWSLSSLSFFALQKFMNTMTIWKWNMIILTEQWEWVSWVHISCCRSDRSVHPPGGLRSGPAELTQRSLYVNTAWSVWCFLVFVYHKLPPVRAMMKRELSQEAKLRFIREILVPTLSCGDVK